MAAAPTRRTRPLALLVQAFPTLSATALLEQVLGLERLGVPLHIYTLDAPARAPQHAATQRVRAHITVVPAQPGRGDAAGLRAHLAALARHPVRHAHALAAAWRRGRAGQRDLQRAMWLADRLQADGMRHLHADSTAQPADLAALVGLVGNLPFSLSAHAGDIHRSRPAELRRKVHAARFTVTVTDTDADRLALRQIAPGAPVHRVRQGVDAAAFHPSLRGAPPAPPLLLSVGQLRERKGLDTLVRACTLLQGSGQRLRCEIVGEGCEAPRLRALIDRLGLADQVHLVGQLTREEVIARLASATVYVQASRVAADGDRDGIPSGLLEAMAMAVPVVATRVSGIPELVQHLHNGLLTEPDDPAELAAAVALLADQPALAQRLGRAARRSVTEQFDSERNLQHLLQLLAQPQPG